MDNAKKERPNTVCLQYDSEDGWRWVILGTIESWVSKRAWDSATGALINGEATLKRYKEQQAA